MIHVDRMTLVKSKVLTGEEEVLKNESNFNETESGDHIDDESDNKFDSVNLKAEQDLLETDALLLIC